MAKGSEDKRKKYNRERIKKWRERNKDKVKEQNRASYLRRKARELMGE